MPDELTEKNPFAKLVVRREDNGKILLEDYAQFTVYSTGWIDENENETSEKACSLITRMLKYQNPFKDEEEVIIIAEYPNQKSFPKIRIRVEREVRYVATQFQTYHEQEEKP